MNFLLMQGWSQPNPRDVILVISTCTWRLQIYKIKSVIKAGSVRFEDVSMYWEICRVTLMKICHWLYRGKCWIQHFLELDPYSEYPCPCCFKLDHSSMLVLFWWDKEKWVKQKVEVKLPFCLTFASIVFCICSLMDFGYSSCHELQMLSYFNLLWKSTKKSSCVYQSFDMTESFTTVNECTLLQDIFINCQWAPNMFHWDAFYSDP